MKKSQIIIGASAFVLAIASAFTNRPDVKRIEKEGYYFKNSVCNDSFNGTCTTFHATGSVQCKTSNNVDLLYTLSGPGSCATTPLYTDPS
jgi:hypothetical protein